MPSTRPLAVAFDCYRTLFTNSYDDWRAQFGRIIEEQRLPFDRNELWDKWRKYELQFRQDRTVLANPEESPEYKTYQQAWTECFERVFRDEGVAGNAAKAGRQCVEDLATRPVFPDTLPALQKLEGRVKLGVFSNADNDSLRPLIASTGIRFDAITSSQSAGVYKPAPAAFHHILGLLGVGAGETWYVGDHLYDDVRGAGDVGITTVWINRTGERPGPADALPDIEITDLRELPELISSLE
jgi:2-haloalkanoic acid dehalogenase type II